MFSRIVEGIVVHFLRDVGSCVRFERVLLGAGVVVLALAFGAASAQASTILAYNFEGLTNGGLIGQDGWSIAYPGSGDAIVTNGVGFDTSKVVAGAGDAYLQRSSLLSSPVFFNSTDTDVTLELWDRPGDYFSVAGVTWAGTDYPFRMSIGSGYGSTAFYAPPQPYFSAIA